MRFDILTLFPGFFESPLSESMLRLARERGQIEVRVHDLRDHGLGRHRVTDDVPYGGGDGMVLRPEPLVEGIESIRREAPEGRTVMLTPQGPRFGDAVARRYARQKEVLIVCGHYGGVDERVLAEAVDEELSIGDYVLTGGETAALVVLDAVARFIPGVLGNAESPSRDSFAGGLLEAPQYTRPREFRGRKVPEVLLTGNHREIDRWRKRQSLLRTRKRRPDLIDGAELTDEDREIIEEIEKSS